MSATVGGVAHARGRVPSGARGTAARRGLARGRRGGTLVLVTVLITALVGVMALVLDVARLRMVGTETQTAADAAALAAARAAQLDATNAATLGPAAAASAAAANRAYDGTARVDAADVRPMRHDPVARTLTLATWGTANAVEVTARATGRYLFAGILGRTSPAVARRATAWIGTVERAACLKPWVLPYDANLYELFAEPAPDPAPDLTQAQYGIIRSRSLAQRTIVLLPRNATSAQPSTGNWYPANYTGAASLAAYGAWVAGSGCGSAAADVAQGALPLLAAADADVVARTTAGVAAGVCTFRGSALCWRSASAAEPGVRTRVVWADVAEDVSGCIRRGNGNGNAWGQCRRQGRGGGGAAAANQSTIRTLGEIVLMCYFRSESDACPAVAGYEGSGWAPPATSGYPEGTIVAIVRGVADYDLGPDVRLGNRVGHVQRLVLVR